MEDYKGYESFAGYYLDLTELVEIVLGDGSNVNKIREDYFLKLKQINLKKEQSIKDGMVIPLEYIFHVFQLNEFEKHCVRLALAPEINRKYESIYQSLQKDAMLCYPTIDFCIQSFASDIEETFILLGQFRERKRILQNIFFMEEKMSKGKSTLSIQLKLNNGILDFILGNGSLNWQLGEEAEIVYPESSREDKFSLHDKIVLDMEEVIQEKQEKVVCYIYGPSGTGKKTIVMQCLNNLGYPLIIVDILKVLQSGKDFLSTIHKIVSEAVLRQADLCFYHIEQILIEDKKIMLESMVPIILEISKEVFFLSEVDWDIKNINIHNCEFIKYKLEQPEFEARKQIWDYFLEKEKKEESLDISILAEHFCFSIEQIKIGVEKAKEVARENRSLITKEILYKCAQEQIKYYFEDNVTNIQSLYTFEQLILPPKQMQILKRICARVQYKIQVFKDWGFNQKILYGKGVSMLFCGPPGTGKTMTAGVIANELHMELYKIDLSMITSKYIGETEKNLKKVFEEGKKGPVILFFDEADALFGKRSEVKDAHDKYANFETSYLLQMMEEYEGVVILATNFAKNFDDAFKRRIKFIVDFPFPNEEERLLMWKNIFPKSCPVKENIDYFFLAKHFQLSGSSIKDVALSAAFLAAQNKEIVDMGYVLNAVDEEMKKKGEILSKEDFGEYYNLLEIHSTTSIS